MKKYLITFLLALFCLAILPVSSQAVVWSKYYPGNVLINGILMSGEQVIVLGASPFELEGETYDAYDLTIAVTDPTADRTLTIPDETGNILLFENANTQDVNLIFEGATSDGNETTLVITDPTADRTITFPDSTGTVYVSGGTDIPVTDGGTGASSLTDHGIMLGSGTDPVTVLGAATNGQLPIGSTGADPVLAALTGTANEITVTNAAGTITLDIPDAVTLNTLTLTNDLTVVNGGTGVGTFTDHGILLGSGTGALTPTAVGTAGQLLLGVNATADPGWQTMGGDVTIGATGTTAIQDDSVARANLIEDSLAVYGIPLQTVKNADGTSLAASAGSGVFGISTGGWGTGTLTLDGEAADNNTKTDTLWFEFALPPEYLSDQDVNLVVTAVESTGNATVATTLSAEVYESDGEGAVSADLYNAFDITDITGSWQTCTAVITDTSLVAGDRLVVFIRIVTNDTAGSVGTVAQIGKIELHLDIKG